MSDQPDSIDEGIDFEGFQTGLQVFGASLLAGVATLFVVALVVTELLSDEVAFSLAIGLPSGLIAGVLVGGGIYVTATRYNPTIAQSGASFVMSFAAGFLIAYFVAVVILELAIELAIGAGIGFGVLVSIVSLLRD